MHILILSQRNAEAQSKLLRAAHALAEFFELDPTLVEALQPNVKEPEVRTLKQREAAAELLECLAQKVGALPPVESPAEPEAPLDPELVTAVTAGANAETLPPPVVENEAALTEPQEINEAELEQEIAATPEADEEAEPTTLARPARRSQAARKK